VPAITIDTNIYVSGLVFPSGNPSRLLELARAGTVQVAISDAIFDEIEDVLKRSSTGRTMTLVKPGEGLVAMRCAQSLLSC